MGLIKDYPYSVLSLKQRQPGKDKNEPRVLDYTYELPNSFNHFFWDMDDRYMNKFA